MNTSTLNILYTTDDIEQDEVITRSAIVDDSLLLCVCEFTRGGQAGCNSRLVFISYYIINNILFIITYFSYIM